MGQVTLFEKERCPHCKRVLEMLQSFRECVLQELAGRGDLPRAPELEIKTIDCGKEGAYAAFCIRATGTFTVPHVFFNEEYVGSAEDFLKLDKDCKGGYNVLRRKLIDLALRESPSPAFPPAPDAALVKVTNELAFSSQPTARQLAALQSFGIKAVLNVLRPDSPAFNRQEADIVRGLDYQAAPIYAVNATSLLRALETLRALPRPVLVHDDVGTRAALVVLLAAAQALRARRPDQDITSATLQGWADGLGLDLRPYRTAVNQVLADPAFAVGAAALADPSASKIAESRHSRPAVSAGLAGADSLAAAAAAAGAALPAPTSSCGAPPAVAAAPSSPA
mmetsp:Transcript_12743/g.40684  ORF Transcript_12743/g.40684 Transcript_12743/m.40684 type:complete len:337 (-) Transcript_12743:217-1227(-)